MTRRTLEEKNPGTYVARLASTFFRVFRFFRGSNSSPDWVADDASARSFVVLKIRNNTTKCTKSTKMKFRDLSTREAFLPFIPSCPSCPSWCNNPKSSGLRVAPEWGLKSPGSPRLFFVFLVCFVVWILLHIGSSLRRMTFRIASFGQL